MHKKVFSWTSLYYQNHHDSVSCDFFNFWTTFHVDVYCCLYYIGNIKAAEQLEVKSKARRRIVGMGGEKYEGRVRGINIVNLHALS